MKRLAGGTIAALCLLLMLPNIALLVTGPRVTDLSWFVALLVVPAGLLVGYFVLLGRKLWLACLLLVPFAALVPLVAFYGSRYGGAITESVLATVVTTNPGEVSDFFANWLWPLVLLTAGAIGLALLAAWLSFRSRLRAVVRRRTLFALGSLAAVVLVAFAGMQLIVRAHLSQQDLANRKNVSLRLARDFQHGYPFGMLVTVGEWWKDRLYMESAISKIRTFHFHVHRKRALHRRQIYVLVIGESSRRNHWQLFGYRRATNPRLSPMHNLVPITHMVSAWPLTIGAVPDMITRKPPTMPAYATFDQPSIVSLMREAGFETWWLSNQSPLGQWDSPIAIYSGEADHVEWLHLHKYDLDLAQALGSVLRKSHGDLFVVLHMMGSHRSYDHRFPSAFKRFTPDMQDAGRFDPGYRAVTNSYDNTIVYTDYVLSRIIAEIKGTGAVAALWYESDHGETLPTATCHRNGHAMGYRYEFPVPALFWYSDAYAHTFPAKVATLRDNAGKRVTGNDTFSTLVDMADLSFRGHDESRSLFSTAWRYRPRDVHPVWQSTGDVVDYDKAVLGDGCEQVRAGPKTLSSRHAAIAAQLK